MPICFTASSFTIKASAESVANDFEKSRPSASSVHDFNKVKPTEAGLKPVDAPFSFPSS